MCQIVRRSLSIPFNGPDYDHCNMFDANWAEVLETLRPPSPNTPTIPCQHGWEFLFDDIPYSTVVSEVNFNKPILILMKLIDKTSTYYL